MYHLLNSTQCLNCFLMLPFRRMAWFALGFVYAPRFHVHWLPSLKLHSAWCSIDHSISSNPPVVGRCMSRCAYIGDFVWRRLPQLGEKVSRVGDLSSPSHLLFLPIFPIMCTLWGGQTLFYCTARCRRPGAVTSTNFQFTQNLLEHFSVRITKTVLYKFE